MTEQIFHGCKVALFIGDQLLIILRDDKPDIAFPNMWDFPGGGREGDETPEETLLREVMEEVGLRLTSDNLIWRKSYAGHFKPDTTVYFFVAKLPEGSEKDVVFGDEGQQWKLISVPDFIELKDVIPSYENRLRDWSNATGQKL